MKAHHAYANYIDLHHGNSQLRAPLACASSSGRLNRIRTSDRFLPDVALERGDGCTRPDGASLGRDRPIVNGELPGDRGLLQRRVRAADDRGGVTARDDETGLIIAEDELAQEGVGLQRWPSAMPRLRMNVKHVLKLAVRPELRDPCRRIARTSSCAPDERHPPSLRCH